MPDNAEFAGRSGLNVQMLRVREAQLSDNDCVAATLSSNNFPPSEQVIEQVYEQSTL